MEKLAAVVVLFAILYAIARAAGQAILAPLHTRLDRIIQLLEAQQPHDPSAEPLDLSGGNRGDGRE